MANIYRILRTLLVFVPLLVWMTLMLTVGFVVVICECFLGRGKPERFVAVAEWFGNTGMAMADWANGNGHD